mgnify:CR=1 FL=1
MLLKEIQDQPSTGIITPGKVGTDIVMGAVLKLMNADIRVTGFPEGIMHGLVLRPPVIGVMLCVEEQHGGDIFVGMVEG